MLREWVVRGGALDGYFGEQGLPVGIAVVVEASAPKAYPRVGGKDLEGWRRTSKYVLPYWIEPWAPP